MPITGQKIYIQPIGLDDTSLLTAVSTAVQETFGFPVARLDAMPIPTCAFNQGRGQYHSTTILKSIIDRAPDDALRVLAVTGVDMYVPQLSFVFGEAEIDGVVCIISLHRLRPEYYGTAPNHKLVTERAVKEAIHELGHTFGLRHSNFPHSVMHFSNTIWDTDRKSAEFTGGDELRLRAKLDTLRRAA